MHVLPEVPEWIPVRLGGLAAGGVGAFRCAEEEAIYRADVEERARRYELQAVRWPEPFPADTEWAMLAATYAKQIGRGVAFSLAAFRQAFAGGRDLGERDSVLIAAAACEMHPAALLKGARARLDRQARWRRRPRRPSPPACSTSPRSRSTAASSTATASSSGPRPCARHEGQPRVRAEREQGRPRPGAAARPRADRPRRGARDRHGRDRAVLGHRARADRPAGARAARRPRVSSRRRSSSPSGGAGRRPDCGAGALRRRGPQAMDDEQRTRGTIDAAPRGSTHEADAPARAASERRPRGTSYKR